MQKSAYLHSPKTIKMKLFTFSLSLCMTVVGFSQNRSIEFASGSFSEILAQAKKENKLIFMDAYTTWCGPCKWMSKNIFTKDEVADYFNSNFINAKFDMEKGEGLDIARKYEVRCYPNLLFLDGDGNLAHRSAGASQDVKDYIELGKTAQDPEKNFGGMLKNYNNKKDDPTFMAHFIDAISMTCLPYKEYVGQYFDMQKEEDYSNQLNWKMIFRHIDDYESKPFQYLLSHRKDFEKLYGKDSVEMKISYTFQQTGNQILYAKDYSKEKYSSYIQKVQESDFNGKEGVVFHLKMNLFQREQAWDELFNYALKDAALYLNPNEVNSICWTAFEKTENSDHLNSAAKLMTNLTSTEEGENWMFLDTEASIYYKLKNKKLAKKAAEKAIRLAEKEDVPEEEYQPTKDLLTKINAL